MYFGSPGAHLGAMSLPAGVTVYDDDLALFEEFVHPAFDAKRLVLVTNQFGLHKVAVYALGNLRQGATVDDITPDAATVGTGLREGEFTPDLIQGEVETPPTPDEGLEPDLTAHARRSTTGGGKGGSRWLAPVAVAAIVVAGCSVEKHYELLSFFFDGVPQPGTGVPSGVGAGAPGRPGPVVIVSSHSAFAERRCEECHGDTGGFGLVVSGFSDLDATVCRNCHAEVAQEYPRMHGPVTAQECLWCHWAHESPNPHLLAQASPDLCLGCHGFELRGLPQPPEHSDLERDCLDCHHGHGGPEPFFLKPADTWASEAGEAESTWSGEKPKEAGASDAE
jgi:predicted CXXCH cytochrome family protein